MDKEPLTPQKRSTSVIRILLVVCITLSILLMYYVNIVKKDYVIFTNPGGPDLEENY